MSRISLILILSFVTSVAAEQALYMVYRSENNGRFWTRSDDGLLPDARINAFTAIEDSIIAGTDSGLFISTNLAKSWQPSNISGSKSARITAVTTAKDHLFAGTFDGIILFSNEKGKLWKTNETFPRQIVRSLHASGQSIFVGTDNVGVYRSTDLGRSWIQLSNGLPPNAQVSALTSINDHIFAGLYARGLYTWNLSEQKWIRVGGDAEIRPLTLTSIGQTLIAGHNPGGIFTSDDLGKTWKPWRGETKSSPNFESPFIQSVSLDAPIWELAANRELAFAGAADGIFYSEDRGRNWTRASRGLPAISPGIAFLVQSNLVLAATLTNHKSRSTDPVEALLK